VRAEGLDLEGKAGDVPRNVARQETGVALLAIDRDVARWVHNDRTGHIEKVDEVCIPNQLYGHRKMVEHSAHCAPASSGLVGPSMAVDGPCPSWSSVTAVLWGRKSIG